MNNTIVIDRTVLLGLVERAGIGALENTLTEYLPIVVAAVALLGLYMCIRRRK